MIISRQKNKQNSLVILLIIFVILFFILFCTSHYLLTEYHEDVHKVTFDRYGCKNITTNIHYNFPFYFSGDTTGICDDKYMSDIKMADNYTESLGYQLTAIVDILFMIIGFLCVFFIIIKMEFNDFSKK